jgi:hypothetical protein
VKPEPDPVRRLESLLEEALLREGEFRLKGAQDALAAAARLDELGRAVAERDGRVHELHLAAAARDRYVHELHLAAIALRDEIRGLHADLEEFTWMLEAAVPRDTAAPDLPGIPFSYHLQTSPFRIYRGDRFTMRGWAFPEDGRAVSGVRVRVDDRVFPGTWGLEEPGAAARPGALPRNPRPGFEVAFETPPGGHRLRLEACLDPGGWVSILGLPIWCRPA